LKNQLINKIQKKQARIAVVGLGYVGLPTAAMFATLGFHVNGLDVNLKIIDGINKNRLETKEVGLEKQVCEARQKDLLHATNVPSEALKAVDIVVACVQTPVDAKGNANLSYLDNACEQIGKHLDRRELVIIQSTVPPGTVYNMVLPVLQKQSGLKCGVDFSLTYCPERMAPGTGLNDLAANPRLIGAYDPESATLGVELFRFVTKGHLLVTDIASAEISKLAENTFRLVNIAFANELALICGQIGVDVNEVIRLANTHPRVNIHQPGCGAGGPCLTKDAQLLLDSFVYGDFKACVIPAALKLNSDMPSYIVNLADTALSRVGKDIRTSRIALLGTAYKGDVDDPRDSPSKGIVLALQQRGSSFVVFDPKCTESFGATKALTLTDAVKDADCIIIATDHKEFCNLDLIQIKDLMNHPPIIVDGKRVIDFVRAKTLGFDYVTTSCVCNGDVLFHLNSVLGS
jgi:UDP-N-acetyl-D-mannosaminuronic acid dehydrogenase